MRECDLDTDVAELSEPYLFRQVASAPQLSQQWRQGGVLTVRDRDACEWYSGGFAAAPAGPLLPAQQRQHVGADVAGVAEVEFYDRLGDPISHAFDSDALKHSVGFAVEWLSPMGLLKFSLAAPLNVVEESARHWGDRTEEFQFSMGQAF